MRERETGRIIEIGLGRKQAALVWEMEYEATELSEIDGKLEEILFTRHSRMFPVTELHY